MLTQEKFEELTRRIQTGKKAIWLQPDNWGSRDPKIIRWIRRWHSLADEWFEDACLRGVFTNTQQQHTIAWHDMKFTEALDKWKHTLKIKRGPDPRTLPRTSFI